VSNTKKKFDYMFSEYEKEELKPDVLATVKLNLTFS
jgi:hypothetical protein